VARRRLFRFRLQLNLTIAHILLMSAFTQATDWPNYRHDERRSAISDDQLQFPLTLSWHCSSRSAPRPAIADPLSHPTDVDFACIRDHSEPVFLDFDHAFHPVAAAGRVFFGSSTGDRVFNVELQGRTVLRDFDPVAAGGGSHRAVVRTHSS
jgi:hypothetical protein